MELPPSFWSHAWTFAVALATGGGLTPLVQYIFKKKKPKVTEPPVTKPADHDRLNKIDYETKKAIDDLGRVVQAASIDASNASKEVRQTSVDMSKKLDDFGKETREYLENFKTAVHGSLSEVHEKSNDANLGVARLEGRVEALEKRAG